jgi:hypothetical protein
MRLLPSCTFLATFFFAASGASLEVIGAGYGRTGTSSLREALNLLGYKTYHMQHVMKQGHVQDWMTVLNGKQALSEVVDTLLVQAGYTATVDFPSMAYWQELADLYPHAKIILTERSSPEEWWQSASQTILVPNQVSRFLFALSPFWRSFGELLQLLWYKTFDLDRPRHVTREDRDLVLQTYLQNSAEARAMNDSSRVLVYQVSQGWEPLCQFLDKPIPDVPFPNLNSRTEFQKHMMTQFLDFAIPVAVVASAVAGMYFFFLASHYKKRIKAA